MARPMAATKLLNYGIRGKRGKRYRGIEKFAKTARHVKSCEYATYTCCVKNLEHEKQQVDWL